MDITWMCIVREASHVNHIVKDSEPDQRSIPPATRPWRVTKAQQHLPKSALFDEREALNP